MHNVDIGTVRPGLTGANEVGAAGVIATLDEALSRPWRRRVCACSCLLKLVRS
jgi:hypothetical protein